MLTAFVLLVRRWLRSRRAVRALPVVPRRVLEARNGFSGLRKRLDRENQLHALMLSQRRFRRD